MSKSVTFPIEKIKKEIDKMYNPELLEKLFQETKDYFLQRMELIQSEAQQKANQIQELTKKIKG